MSEMGPTLYSPSELAAARQLLAESGYPDGWDCAYGSQLGPRAEEALRILGYGGNKVTINMTSSGIVVTVCSSVKYPDSPNVDIVGRAKAATTRRVRRQEIAEYLLVKMSHDRPDYQSMRYLVDRIDKDGYVIETHGRSTGLIAPGTEVYEERSFVYSTSEYDKFGPFEYQIRDISSEWWIGNSWDVVELAVIDDHGDSFISATVTELNPDFNWFAKASMLQIHGELETPDDIDYFSFEAYGGEEFFIFSPRFLPLATDTGGGIPKIAIYGASWFTPFATIGVFEDILTYTPASTE
jgi:hypothetical protein